MTVLVLSDSAAALDPGTAADYAVRMVPMTVTVDGQGYDDGELADEELERRMQHGHATTSAPAPGAYLSRMEDATDGAVVVTVAQRLSNSHQSAVLAGRLLSEQGGAGPVEVVDSGSAAGAQALVVLAAARAAQQGHGVQEVAAAARGAVDHVRLIGTLGSFDRLVQGGRVPGIAAAAGRALGVNPLFELAQGHVRPLRPSFSRGAALDRLVSLFLESRTPGHVVEVVVSHALAADAAAQLLAAVQAEVQPALALTGSFGAALLAHAGPGTVGLSWRWVDSATAPE